MLCMQLKGNISIHCFSKNIFSYKKKCIQKSWNSKYYKETKLVQEVINNWNLLNLLTDDRM